MSHDFAPAVLAVLLAATLGCGAAGDGPAGAEEGTILEIEIVSGDQQSAPAGTAVADLLVVQVTDRGEEPRADVPVSWTVAQGTGQLAIKRQRTDPQGLAAASLFLANGATDVAVRAEIVGGSGVTFTARAATTPMP